MQIYLVKSELLIINCDIEEQYKNKVLSISKWFKAQWTGSFCLDPLPDTMLVKGMVAFELDDFFS